MNEVINNQYRFLKIIDSENNGLKKVYIVYIQNLCLIFPRKKVYLVRSG